MQEKEYKYFSCVSGVDEIHSSGFVQQGGDYAALRPRDGFTNPHKEHRKYIYILNPLN